MTFIRTWSTYRAMNAFTPAPYLRALVIRRALMVLVLACLLPVSASAALGGDVESIRADQAAFDASQQIADHGGYAVYTLQSPAGLTIREYLAPDGTVFAVAWAGPMLPDLKRLLDGYFTRYTDAVHARRGGHGHREIRLSDLVVESGGHMRAFFGRAYLPHSLPDGVAAAAIR